MHGARVFCGRMLGFFDSLAGRVSHGARACQTFTAGHPCEASGRLPVFHSVSEVVGSLCPLLDLRACGARAGDQVEVQWHEHLLRLAQRVLFGLPAGPATGSWGPPPACLGSPRLRGP